MPHPFIPIDPPPTEPNFSWSDWDPYAAVGSPPVDRVEELGLCSDRALVAYTIALAEWVVHRFKNMLDDTIPIHFLQAAWVSEIDPHVNPPPESDEANWKGPMRGSIDLALMTVLNAMASMDGGKPEVDAALAEQIAGHIWNWSPSFVAWRDVVVPRLQRVFPRQRDDRRPVAPAMFTTAGYDPRDTEAQISAFLASVNFEENFFLKPTGPP